MNVCYKELYEDKIRVATKDGLPTSMLDELEDKIEAYRSIPNEEWRDLLSTLEVKHKRKIAVSQINRLEISKEAPVNSDRDNCIKVTRKEKANTGFMPTYKQ